DNPDDAAVVQPPVGKLLVHTVDYLRSLVKDPFIFGQIAANHCLNDLWAMGATPHNALAIATIPYGKPKQVEESLYQLLAGITKTLQQHQIPLIGGHSSEGSELSLGLACNGFVEPAKLLRKSGMEPGQVLILTKALGTGTLFAAAMRHQAKGRWLEEAVSSMLISNQQAAQLFQAQGATACTDVSGFGLVGHLVEMVQASQVSIELNLEAIPILTGAINTINMGITSSLQPQNLLAAHYLHTTENLSSLSEYQLLFDPQTSGGLLATVPPANVETCLHLLQEKGYQHSCVIGKVQGSLRDDQMIHLM
ncbi:MAG: selenide, water dikinase SelD, partial [Okeania sp. SIO2D1]|nr:selenide, water dikinase SelD [Okeania sp. SIO2D1]